ncbi:MAG: hypothetical protein ACRCTP_04385 [Aeromonas popoffii]|uniref:hypothetical protein n=1 Tax=Aeromonas popoffii TaxID=70856 RepID=UPI003F335402
MKNDISLEDLVLHIKKDGEGLSQVKMAAKFGVSRRRIASALKLALSVPEAAEMAEADIGATITTTENGCVSVVPSGASPASVGDVYKWGMNGDNVALVVWVDTDSKELGITRILDLSSDDHVLHNTVDLVTFRNWKKRKNLTHVGINHKFIFCLATAKDEKAWDGKAESAVYDDKAGKNWLEIYGDRFISIKESDVAIVEDVVKEVDHKILKSATGKMSECPYRLTVSTRSITIIEGSKVLTVTTDEGQRFQKATEAMNEGDWDTLHKLCSGRSERADDYQKTITKLGFTIKGGYVVMNNGTGQIALGGLDSILKRLEAFSISGNEKGVMALGRFIDKLLDNPDINIMNRVVDFVKFADVEIDEDGDIITYKYVDGDYMDSYSHKLDNRPGAEVFMKRALVDPNIDNECSQGLHVCALSYAFKFWSSGKRLVRTKLNPRDIVAIPRDYKGAKIRTCRYSSIADVTDKFLQRKIPVDFKGFFSSGTA